ncbi:dehydrogenase/reductase SDR family member 7 isoform X2 [Phyllobates terribilis]|uniref:dehydrogenase/reductase SDR family member 7 isoform X2 n=1 Tax=Phyllobates terribilis TaxID=111132 RepID=UPI003CCAD469
MDVLTCCTLLVLGCLLYSVLQLVRLSKADADLTLLWAERFGSSPESKLRGSVIWVTGASSGIGEELCYQLAKLGASLILSSRRKDELLRVKKKCLGLDVYQGLMNLNYIGTVSITKHVLPHMIERKRGKIITLSSITGLIGVPLSSGYAASKHALQGFFNCLRIELGAYPDIAVINICPGPVQSKVVENACTEQYETSFETVTDQTHKMATDRCVRLILVSAANNLKEAWIADQPFLILYYLWQYAPTWGWWITQKGGQKRIQNFKSGIDADSTFAFSKKTS